MSASNRTPLTSSTSPETLSSTLLDLLKNQITQKVLMVRSNIGGSSPHYLAYASQAARDEAFDKIAADQTNTILFNKSSVPTLIGFNNAALASVLEAFMSPANQYKSFLPAYDATKDAEQKEMAQKLAANTPEANYLAITAAQKGYIETLSYLLDSRKVSADSVIKTPFKQWRSTLGMTAYEPATETTLLFEALQQVKPQRGIALMLLENYPLSQATINHSKVIIGTWTTHKQGTALMSANLANDVSLMQLLLAKGAKMEVSASKDATQEPRESSSLIPR